ncbi:MAG: sugar phosphate nucleotidyltransferase [Candidatus Berkelbacteria bacterium]
MERERITISIKKEILERIDRKVDGTVMRNRSHAFEHLLSEALGIAKIESAVIMAGGKGAIRLIPVIENSILQLKEYGLSDITIAIGFLGEKIKQSIGAGERFGLKISYVESGDGTAGALNKLRNKFKKTFLVVNLDQVISINLSSLINFHLNHQPLASVASSDQKLLKGFYVLEPDIFSFIPDGFSMLEEDVFPKLINQNKLLIFPIIN